MQLKNSNSGDLSPRHQSSIQSASTLTPSPQTTEGTIAYDDLKSTSWSTHSEFRRLPSIVWTTNSRLRITSLGGGAFGSFGLNPERLIGRTVDDCFSNQGYSVIHAHHSAMIGHATTSEYVRSRKAFRFQIQPLHSSSGRILGCIGLAVDITRRDMTHKPLHAASLVTDEQILIQSHSKRSHDSGLNFTALSRASMHPTDAYHWVYDVNCKRLVLFTPSPEVLWGIPIDELLQSPIDTLQRLLDPNDFRLLTQVDVDRIEGAGLHREIRLRTPNGKNKTLLLRAFPVKSRLGMTPYIAGTCEDVTLQNHAEHHRRRAERLLTLGSFTAGVAHEVSTPLSAALASASTALQILPPSASIDLQNALTVTLSCIQRCSSAVKSLLQFCRDEPTELRKVDLRKAIDFAMGITSQYASDSRCRIHHEVSITPLYVRGNLTQLELALINLLRNAIDAGARTVAIKCETKEKHTEIHTVDDGCGLDEVNIHQLCDPLSTIQHVGAGLGLSIVNKIVHEHQGVLGFVRHPDKGTTVTITLPHYFEDSERNEQ